MVWANLPMAMPTVPVTLTAHPPAGAITVPIIMVNRIVVTMSTRGRYIGTDIGIRDQSITVGMAAGACSGLMANGMTGIMHAGQAGTGNTSTTGSVWAATGTVTMVTGTVTAVIGTVTVVSGTVTVGSGAVATRIGTVAMKTGTAITAITGIMGIITRAWHAGAARQARHLAA